MIQKFLPIEMQLTYQVDGEPLGTRHEPVLGNIVENSAYTNAVGSTASVISANAKNEMCIRDRAYTTAHIH